MRRLFFALCILACIAFSASAQDFDITGLYLGFTVGMPVKIKVDEPEPGEYLFLFMSNEEDILTFHEARSSSNKYQLDLDGDYLNLQFRGTDCTITSEYDTDTFTIIKEAGDPGEVAGRYSAFVDEGGELVLEAIPTDTGFRFTIEAWELEMTATVHKQNGNFFDLKTNFNEPATLDFTPESCTFSAPGEQPLVLGKDRRPGLAPSWSQQQTEGLIADDRTMDFTTEGDVERAFQKIYGVPMPASESVPAAMLTAIDSREIELEGQLIHSLSPNGRSILAYSPVSVFVYDARSLEKRADFLVERGLSDPNSVVWSPDGRRIAFTDNFFVYMMEPDIRLIDLDRGELRNLTQDNASKSPMSGSTRQSALIDVTPVWAPDGHTLIFQRILKKRSVNMEARFFSLPAEGGIPEPVSGVIAQGPSIVSLKLEYPTGRFIYSFTHSRGNPEDDGLWILDSVSPQLRQILSNSRIGIRFTALADIAFRGGEALIFYPDRLQPQAEVTKSERAFALLNLESGKRRDLVPGTGSSGERCVNAVLSPAGSKVLYLYRNLETEKTILAVRDIGGGTEEKLLEWDNTFPGIVQTNGLLGMTGLDWATDDTVMVVSDFGNRAFLIALEVLPR